MRILVAVLGLVACGGGGGEGGGGFSSLIPRVAWSEVEIEDLTPEGAVPAIAEAEAVLRVVDDQAWLRTTPHRTVEVLPVAETGGTFQRRTRKLVVADRQTAIGLQGLICNWMLEETDLTSVIADTTPLDPEASDMDRARGLCEQTVQRVNARLDERLCRGRSSNAAHDLLFPLPEVAEERFEPTRVPFDASLGTPVAVADGAVWLWARRATGGTLTRLDVDTGEVLGTAEAPDQPIDVVVIASDVLAVGTRDGVHRRIGDGPWELIAPLAVPRLVSSDALWFQDQDGLWRHPHDAAADAAPEPIPGWLPGGISAFVSLEVIRGEVHTRDQLRPRRWTGRDWEVVSDPLGTWRPGLVTHDDGWGLAVVNGVLARVEASGRVSLAEGDVCSGAMALSALLGDGQDLIGVEQGAWFRVPAP